MGAAAKQRQFAQWERFQSKNEMGFPNIGGPFGVLTLRAIVFWGPWSGPPIWKAAKHVGRFIEVGLVSIEG